MLRCRRPRSILIVLVTALCVTGIQCNLWESTAPPRRDPGTLQVDVRSGGAGVPGVELRVERYELCPLFSWVCFPDLLESRTATSDAQGHVAFETLTYGTWKLIVVGNDGWTPVSGTESIFIPPGTTVNREVQVTPLPARAGANPSPSAVPLPARAASPPRTQHP